MNTLTPAAPGSFSSLGSSSTFSRVAPTKKAKSQYMRPRPRRDLVGERLSAHRRGLGVRHLEHGGDAAEHGRPAAGFQIFLVLEPWLAEMHLGVDDAGQDVQAGGVEGPAGGLGSEAANRDDAAVLHADIGKTLRRHD